MINWYLSPKSDTSHGASKKSCGKNICSDVTNFQNKAVKKCYHSSPTLNEQTKQRTRNKQKQIKQKNQGCVYIYIYIYMCVCVCVCVCV